jgi:hypothetical protein
MHKKQQSTVQCEHTPSLLTSTHVPLLLLHWGAFFGAPSAQSILEPYTEILHVDSHHVG